MKKIFSVILLAISFAYIESSVVVYLREIFYPEGFYFPLKVLLNNKIFFVELFREIATLILIFSVSFILGENLNARFGYFLFVFGLWDIFYYIFLSLTISWPSSVFDWDILFLIPWAWVSPVLAPVICSILMVGFGGYFIFKKVRFKLIDLILLFLGCAFILYTFLYDYGRILFNTGFKANQIFYKEVSTYIPEKFNWGVFYFGLLLIVFSFLISILRKK